MSAFLHAANVVVLASFLARDIFWLRLLSILAGGLFIVFYGRMDPVLWEGIAWNVLFITINVVQLARLVAERRPVQLTDAEARLHHSLFGGLDPRELRRLVSAGTWQDHPPETTLIRQGQTLDHLFVVLDGHLEVHADGTRVATLDAGRLVGELSWVTGNPPGADVRTTRDTRCLCWSRTELDALLAARPAIQQALQQAIGRDLARKLGAQAR